jgi:hypothetical protein
MSDDVLQVPGTVVEAAPTVGATLSSLLSLQATGPYYQLGTCRLHDDGPGGGYHKNLPSRV